MAENPVEDIKPPAPKYKKILMYDAERGKNVCRSITCSQFKDEAEMNAYIKVLRDEMKAKNKAHRDQQARAGIEAKLQGVVPVDLTAPADLKLPPELQHAREINLRMDKSSGNTIVIFGSSKKGKSTAMLEIYRKYFSHGAPEAAGRDYISTLRTRCRLAQPPRPVRRATDPAVLAVRKSGIADCGLRIANCKLRTGKLSLHPYGCVQNLSGWGAALLRPG